MTRRCAGMCNLVLLCMLCPLGALCMRANALPHIILGNGNKQQRAERHHVHGATATGLRARDADVHSDGSDGSSAALWEDDIEVDVASAEPYRSAVFNKHNLQNAEPEAQHDDENMETIASTGRRLLHPRYEITTHC